jgi:hypothetical protein
MGFTVGVATGSEVGVTYTGAVTGGGGGGLVVGLRVGFKTYRGCVGFEVLGLLVGGLVGVAVGCFEGFLVGDS